jgi:hypothetical protein
MKRDMQIVRDILVFIEDDESPDGPPAGIQLHQHDADAVDYNLQLLIDAGLVNGEIHRYIGGAQSHYIRGLTMQGHDFAQALRNETVWNRLKTALGSELGGASLKVLATVAVELMKDQVKAALGLKP